MADMGKPRKESKKRYGLVGCLKTWLVARSPGCFANYGDPSFGSRREHLFDCNFHVRCHGGGLYGWHKQKLAIFTQDYEISPPGVFACSLEPAFNNEACHDS